MPLMLDNMRAEFARHMANDPQARFSMDKALAHVITIAYERGLDDSRRDSNREAAQKLVHDILDPEMYGHAVTQEVRDAARKAKRSAGQWISIAERMPEENELVILYRPQANLTNDPEICVGWRTFRKNESPQGVVHYFDCWCHPTHWIPLPGAPNAELTGAASSRPG